MFPVYVHKKNTDDYKRFLIPKNNGYNCKSWVEIEVDNIKKQFVAFKIENEVVPDEEWEIKYNYAFPSSLLTEFLRKDYEEID